MNLCAGDRKHAHDEVCYEKGYCPVCSALDEMDEEMERGAKVDRENEELSNKITDLEREIAELKREPLLTDIRAANGMLKDT